jgi:hypothetical protein
MSTRLPSKRARGGFTYRPREKAKHRPRNLGRRVLTAAAMEEFRLGGDGMASLYAALLIRRLVAIEPDLDAQFGARATLERN